MPKIGQRPRIFISYRRSDTAMAAGRLYDRLTESFGKDNVFMDIGTIDPGDDFVNAIQNAIHECSAVVIVIGRQWLTTTDSGGNRRLDNADDFVRLEAVAALEAATARGVRVIPVLVDGATMPQDEQLPEPLRSLARRNALEITDKRFDYDTSLLIQAIDPSKALAPSSRLPGRRSLGGLVILALLIGLAGILAVVPDLPQKLRSLVAAPSPTLVVLPSETPTRLPTSVAAAPTPAETAAAATSSEACAPVVSSPLNSSDPGVQKPPDFWLQYPVSKPIISQTFGANPSLYRASGLPGHDGIDFAASEGTPVLAAQSGLVILSDPGGTLSEKLPLGTYVKIKHDWFGDEWQTIYTHMSSLLVVEGQFVTAGQMIGRIGRTGNVTGASLHFGLQHKGATAAKLTNFPSDIVDPQPLLTDTPKVFKAALLVSSAATKPLTVNASQSFCVHFTILNTGNQPWDGVSLAPYSGYLPGEAVDIPPKKPGERYEVQFTLQAYSHSGDFSGVWMLRDKDGVFFPSPFVISVTVR